VSELVKHSALFAIATLMSRLLGLVRDATFAHYFGRSSQYDAYLIAIMLPFFLRRVFAEGALSSTFIPLFTQKKDTEGQKFFSTSFWLMLFVTSALYIPVFFFSDQISFILGTGFNAETLELTSFLMKFTYPFIVFISLWALVSGVLNVENSFFIPAIAPAISNITTIIGIFLSFVFLPKILGPTIGFTLGGLFQLIFVYFFMRKRKYKITFEYDRKYVKEILSLFGPSLLGVAVSTLNTVIDTNVATWTGSGGVATIQYALRLYQLPLGIFAVSVANSLLPKLAKAFKDNDRESYRKNVKESVESMMFFTVPSTIGLILLSEEIIGLVFQHGNFTYSDTVITAKVLAYYSVGLPAYSLHQIFTRTFHSRLNTKTPSYISIVMLIVNGALDIILAKYMGVAGIAIATSVSGFVGMVLTGYTSFKTFTSKDILENLKIIAAGLVMGLFIVLVKDLYSSRLFTVLIVFTSVIIYFIFSYIFKIENAAIYAGMIKNKFIKKRLP